MTDIKKGYERKSELGRKMTESRRKIKEEHGENDRVQKEEF